MSKKTIVYCDVCGIDNDGAKVWEKYKMDVIFTTEQTEGRSCEPYLSDEQLDICENCIRRVIHNRKYIIASGGQGHNTYTLPKESDND